MFLKLFLKYLFESNITKSKDAKDMITVILDKLALILVALSSCSTLVFTCSIPNIDRAIQIKISIVCEGDKLRINFLIRDFLFFILLKVN